MTISVRNSAFKKILMLVDIIVFNLVSILSIYFRFPSLELGASVEVFVNGTSINLLIGVLVFMYIAGAYEIRRNSYLEIFYRTVMGGVLGLVLAVFALYLNRSDIAGLYGRGILLGSFSSFLVLILALRLYFHSQFKKIERAWRWYIISGDAVPSRLVQELDGKRLPGEKLWITPEAALKLTASEANEIVVAGSHGDLPKQLSAQLLDWRMKGASVWSLPHLFERFWQKVPVFFVQDDWFWASEGFVLAHNEWSLRFKRVLDIGLSTFLLILVWPVMLITSLVIKLESPGPSIYTQVRTGRNGRDFIILKFRSMKLDAEKNGPQWAQNNDDRLLKIGKFIRKTRIDELPQLWNVIVGDMSFIGPRPERPEFNKNLEKEIPYYNLRHLVRPGLTGWAQVNYPYGASIDDAIHKLEYDLFYIKNYSILLDLQILFKTVRVVLLGKGL